MARTRKTKVVVVEWFDASYQRGELTTEEINPLVLLTSAGFLIREDEESISIALDRYDEDGTWRHIQHIPKVNVRRVRRFQF